MPEAYTDNLEHIKDELARLDLMIQREVRKIRSPRKGNEVPGLYISDKEIDALLASNTKEGGPIRF